MSGIDERPIRQKSGGSPRELSVPPACVASVRASRSPPAGLDPAGAGGRPEIVRPGAQSGGAERLISGDSVGGQTTRRASRSLRNSGRSATGRGRGRYPSGRARCRPCGSPGRGGGAPRPPSPGSFLEVRAKAQAARKSVSAESSSGERGRGILEGLLASAQPRQEHRPARQGRRRLRVMGQGPVQDLDGLLGPAERLGEHARLAPEGRERFRVELAGGAEVLQRPGGIGRQPIQAARDPAQLVAGKRGSAPRDGPPRPRPGPPGPRGPGCGRRGRGSGRRAAPGGGRGRRSRPARRPAPASPGRDRGGRRADRGDLEDAVEIGQRPVEIASHPGRRGRDRGRPSRSPAGARSRC